MKKINNIQVSVVSGNITTLENVNAIVIPQFNNCVSYGGVGGAAFRAGMEEGLEAYQCYLDNLEHDVPFGTVVHTQSGAEHIPYLLHAVSVGAPQDEAMDVVSKCVLEALKRAQENGHQVIAIPALGTGIIGDLTDQQSIVAILNGIWAFDNAQSVVKEVKIVVYRLPEQERVFNQVLAAYTRKIASTKGARPAASFDKFIGSIIADLELNSGFDKAED